MTRRLGLVSVVAAALAAGCGHLVQLQPQGRPVHIVTKAPSEDCDDLGTVFGKSNHSDLEQAMIGARNDLRNRAGAKGATHVVLETNNGRAMNARVTEVLLSGVALSCGK